MAVFACSSNRFKLITQRQQYRWLRFPPLLATDSLFLNGLKKNPTNVMSRVHTRLPLHYGGVNEDGLMCLVSGGAGAVSAQGAHFTP